MHRHHHRPAALALILVSLVLVLAACQEDPAAPYSGDKRFIPDTLDPIRPPSVQDQLAEMWADSEAMRYEQITGAIDPWAGGWIKGAVDSWPGYVFSIYFAPGVLDGIEPRTFTMHVPQRGSRDGAYFKFEERGREDETVKFNGKAQVTVYWPRDLEQDSDWFVISCLNRTDANHDGVFEYSRTDETLCYPRDPASPKIVFGLTHFSRWIMQNGKNGTP
jgi:hypothetical protein